MSFGKLHILPTFCVNHANGRYVIITLNISLCQFPMIIVKVVFMVQFQKSVGDVEGEFLKGNFTKYIFLS